MQRLTPPPSHSGTPARETPTAATAERHPSDSPAPIPTQSQTQSVPSALLSTSSDAGIIEPGLSFARLPTPETQEGDLTVAEAGKDHDPEASRGGSYDGSESDDESDNGMWGEGEDVSSSSEEEEHVEVYEGHGGGPIEEEEGLREDEGLEMAVEEEGSFAPTEIAGPASGSASGNGGTLLSRLGGFSKETGTDTTRSLRPKATTGKPKGKGKNKGKAAQSAFTDDGNRSKRSRQRNPSGPGQGKGGAFTYQGGGTGKDLYESEIVAAWNKDFGDVCKPSAPAAVAVADR